MYLFDHPSLRQFDNTEAIIRESIQLYLPKINRFNYNPTDEKLNVLIQGIVCLRQQLYRNCIANNQILELMAQQECLQK